MADGSSAGPVLPSSNRGVSEFRQEPGTIQVGFDWCSFSVDVLASVRECGVEPSSSLLTEVTVNPEAALTVAAHLFAFYFAGCGLELSEEVKGGRFYQWRVPILGEDGSFVGVIELGGENTARSDGTATARLELTGQGCRSYEATRSGHGGSRWLELRAKLESCAGRLTRLDICADDLQGAFPLRVAKSWWESGDFDNRGQRPIARLHDDLGSRKGSTLYIGSEKSERQLRVYEKGRQLGDMDSEWVRYEAQFRASNRKELPLDMLRDPQAYLVGAYPVLRFLAGVVARIDVTKETAAATWKSVRRHLKRQYGATLNFMVAQTRGDAELARLIKTLTSERLPPWARSNAAALHWPDIVAINECPQEG